MRNLEFPLHNLYDRLPIPLDCISSISSLRQTIQDALEQFYSSYQEELPADGTDIAYQSMLKENMIDFGRLMKSTSKIIRSIANSTDLQKNIKEACGLQILDEQVIDTNRKAVTEQFSLFLRQKNLQYLSVNFRDGRNSGNADMQTAKNYWINSSLPTA